MSSESPDSKAISQVGRLQERERERAAQDASRRSYVPPSQKYAKRFGTAQRDPMTGRVMPGEVDGRGLPMGVPGGGGPGQPMSGPAARDPAFRGAVFNGSPLRSLANDNAWNPADQDSRQVEGDAARGIPIGAGRSSGTPTPLQRIADGGYGAVTDVTGSSGQVHHVQSQIPTSEVMENAAPGFAAMPQTQKQSVLRSLAHNDSGGVTTSEAASPFNIRGERAIQTPDAPNGGTEYNPLHDLVRNRVPQEYVPPGADRAVMIDPKYRTPGMPAYGTGTGDASAGATPASGSSSVPQGSAIAPVNGAPQGPTTSGDTVDWQGEVMKRYPRIGVAGSPENAAFVDAFKQHNDPTRGMATAHAVMGRDPNGNWPDSSQPAAVPDTGEPMPFTPAPPTMIPKPSGAPVSPADAGATIGQAARTGIAMKGGSALAGIIGGIGTVASAYQGLKGGIGSLLGYKTPSDSPAAPIAGATPPVAPPAPSAPPAPGFFGASLPPQQPPTARVTSSDVMPAVKAAAGKLVNDNLEGFKQLGGAAKAVGSAVWPSTPYGKDDYTGVPAGHYAGTPGASTPPTSAVASQPTATQPAPPALPPVPPAKPPVTAAPAPDDRYKLSLQDDTASGQFGNGLNFAAAH